ncbi:unnamed protein product [Heligmosomoides polygyrus]|uniref:DUF3989 domain-containing protein n=1 Tax=Heligmosomoides polygyrus TaxID=6339 RepID=A0A183GR78_HELPZ|nr:unnamed protein product [Heligmosomoides polygyrus]
MPTDTFQSNPEASGEQLWSSLIQQKIPDSQKLAFQQLVRELLEQRKAVHKLWKYVVLFLVIGALAAFAVYFLTCWAEYLEVLETKYTIREEIFASGESLPHLTPIASHCLHSMRYHMSRQL